eukprot:9310561-Pyramimonas_sp.AAC.1
MFCPSWNYVASLVQGTQVSIQHGGPELVPRCPVSRPHKWVSNMVVPRWSHVFSRVQTTQVGI